MVLYIPASRKSHDSRPEPTKSMSFFGLHKSKNIAFPLAFFHEIFHSVPMFRRRVDQFQFRESLLLWQPGLKEINILLFEDFRFFD